MTASEIWHQRLQGTLCSLSPDFAKRKEEDAARAQDKCQSQGKCEKAHRVIIWLEGEQVGRHVGNCPLVSHPGHFWGWHRGCESHVTDLDSVPLETEDVSGLDVPVNEATRMHVLEAAHQLD